MKKSLFILLILICSNRMELSGQFSIGTGGKNIQFSGFLLGFYNQRFLESGDTDHSKNRFNLDFGVLRVQASNKSGLRSELQINVPAIYSPDQSDEFLMQATIDWRNRKNNFSASVGYDKLPFSSASMRPQMESAFLQRPEVVRGKTFNRRDMGITLEKGFLNRRLNLIGGIYTGQGIGSITGDNDENGKFLYVGRVEAHYPSRFRNEEIDLNHSPIPRFCIGADISYSEKTVTTGTDYPILTVDGKKTSYSADFSAAWRGLSYHFEWITFNIQPNNVSLLLGKPTDYYRAQGVISQLDYYSKRLKSVFALRYDEFNPNDLIKGDNRQTLSFAYNYLIDGLNSAIKVHYFYRMQANDAAEQWAPDQLRIGWQCTF